MKKHFNKENNKHLVNARTLIDAVYLRRAGLPDTKDTFKITKYLRFFFYN